MNNVSAQNKTDTERVVPNTAIINIKSNHRDDAAIALRQVIAQLQKENSHLIDEVRRTKQYTQRIQTDSNTFRKESAKLLARCNQLERNINTLDKGSHSKKHPKELNTSRWNFSILSGAIGTALSQIKTQSIHENLTFFKKILSLHCIVTKKCHQALDYIQTNQENTRRKKRIASTKESIKKNNQKRKNLVKKYDSPPKVTPSVDNNWFIDNRS